MPLEEGSRLSCCICWDWAEAREKCRCWGCSSVGDGMRWPFSWSSRCKHHDTSGFSLQSAIKACFSSLSVPMVSRRVKYFPAKACHESCKGYLPDSARTCKCVVCMCTPSSLFKMLAGCAPTFQDLTCCQQRTRPHSCNTRLASPACQIMGRPPSGA